MWKDAYLDSRILSADPLELVHILYEHAIEMVHEARTQLAAGDIRARGRAVARALAAIDQMNRSLDIQAGGSISKNLLGLYQYMRLRLVAANIRQEDEPLAEVEGLLKTLDEAWSAIRHGQPAEAETAQPAVPPSFGAFGLEPQVEYASQGWNA